MKAITMIPVFLVLLILPAYADIQCESCATYRDIKECGSAAAESNDAAMAKLKAALVEKIFVKRQSNLDCGGTKATCVKGCPKKPATSKPVLQGTGTRIEKQSGGDTRYEMCLDNCEVSLIKCTQLQTKTNDNIKKHIEENMKLEAMTCAEKK